MKTTRALTAWLGLGENVPINTGNQSEGLLVLKDGEWVVPEGGKGTTTKAIRFQLRPDPLAR
jgi:hypothetical protein